MVRLNGSQTYFQPYEPLIYNEEKSAHHKHIMSCEQFCYDFFLLRCIYLNMMKTEVKISCISQKAKFLSKSDINNICCV